MKFELLENEGSSVFFPQSQLVNQDFSQVGFGKFLHTLLEFNTGSLKLIDK
jgi:hypothetical protein